MAWATVKSGDYFGFSLAEMQAELARYKAAIAASRAAYHAYKDAEEAAFIATRDANARVAALHRQMIDAEMAAEAALATFAAAHDTANA